MPDKPKWRPSKKTPIVPLDPDYEIMVDPANGARVPRCGACGVPNPIELVGTRGGLFGHFPLCEACWRSKNPVDPLTA